MLPETITSSRLQMLANLFRIADELDFEASLLNKERNNFSSLVSYMNTLATQLTDGSIVNLVRRHGNEQEALKEFASFIIIPILSNTTYNEHLDVELAVSYFLSGINMFEMGERFLDYLLNKTKDKLSDEELIILKQTKERFQFLNKGLGVIYRSLNKLVGDDITSLPPLVGKE